jgi:hypothetical protein
MPKTGPDRRRFFELDVHKSARRHWHKNRANLSSPGHVPKTRGIRQHPVTSLRAIVSKTSIEKVADIFVLRCLTTMNRLPSPSSSQTAFARNAGLIVVDINVV